MLAQTLFLCALLAIFAASAVASVAGGARSAGASAARALIAPGIEAALAAYQRYVAETVAAEAGTPPATYTAEPARLPALNAQTAWSEQRYLEAPDGGSPLRVAVDVVPTATSAPSCGGGGSGPDVAHEAQCSPFAQESRLSLALTAAAGPVDANGAVSALAQSRYTVTLRLFAQPPYAAVSGALDAQDPNGPHEADGAGWGDALGPFGTPLPGDTTIHVVYGCTPGTGSCAFSAPPPADAPTSLPWTDGNGTP